MHYSELYGPSTILHDGKNSSRLDGGSRHAIMNLMNGNNDTTNSSQQMDTSNDSMLAQVLSRLGHLEDMNKRLVNECKDLKDRLRRRKRHISEKYALRELSRSRSRNRNNKRRSDDEDDSYF